VRPDAALEAKEVREAVASLSEPYRSVLVAVDRVVLQGGRRGVRDAHRNGDEPPLQGAPASGRFAQGSLIEAV
jgi:hypothetical protein